MLFMVIKRVVCAREINKLVGTSVLLNADVVVLSCCCDLYFKKAASTTVQVERQ